MKDDAVATHFEQTEWCTATTNNILAKCDFCGFSPVGEKRVWDSGETCLLHYFQPSDLAGGGGETELEGVRYKGETKKVPIPSVD